MEAQQGTGATGPPTSRQSPILGGGTPGFLPCHWWPVPHPLQALVPCRTGLEVDKEEQRRGLRISRCCHFSPLGLFPPLFSGGNSGSSLKGWLFRPSTAPGTHECAGRASVALTVVNLSFLLPLRRQPSNPCHASPSHMLGLHGFVAAEVLCEHLSARSPAPSASTASIHSISLTGSLKEAPEAHRLPGSEPGLGWAAP